MRPTFPHALLHASDNLQEEQRLAKVFKNQVPSITSAHAFGKLLHDHGWPENEVFPPCAKCNRRVTEP